MSGFVEVELTTEEQALREEGIAKLKELLELKGYSGWEANEADLSIINISSTALMAAMVAQIAAVVPPAVFRKYGTELVKIPYNEGTAATVTTKWTLLEEGGEYAAHTIEAGTQLAIGNLPFYVKENTTVAKTESTKNVVLVAAERGTEFNGLTGTVELVDAIAWVKEVSIIGETSGGVNQETDEEYENRLANALKLQAPRPITAPNFAEQTLQIPTSKLPAGVAIARTTAIDGYNPSTITIEAKTNSSTTLTEVSTFTGVSLESVSLPQKHPGSQLKYEGDTLYEVLTRNCTAVSKKAAAEMVITPAALKSEAKHKIEVTGKYEEQRTVTVFVKVKGTTAVTTETKTKIKEYLEEYRELNFVIYVEAASYNEIQIKTKLHLLPGYVEATVKAQVKAALENYLSPETYGNPIAQETGVISWLNATQAYNVVRYNSILGVIENVPGVQYVFSGSAGLAIGLAEAPGSKTADLTLYGPAPLTETKAAGITVEIE